MCSGTFLSFATIQLVVVVQNESIVGSSWFGGIYMLNRSHINFAFGHVMNMWSVVSVVFEHEAQLFILKIL